MAFIENRTMRYARLFITLLCAAAVGTVGCTKDDLEAMPEPTAPGETRFQLAVASYEVKASARAAEPSPVPEPESDEEKAIRDFWLFQFNTDGSQLVAPKYYPIENYTGDTDAAKLSAMLNDAFKYLERDKPMTIYIVTNTGDETWATQTPADFDTLDEVKAQTLPSPRPIHILADPAQTDAIFIPMSGQLGGITVKDDSFVVVPVTRMYAKVKIQATFHEEGMNVYDVDVKGIPWYCRVAPVGTLDANGAVPLGNTEMVSRAFSSTDAITADADGTKWLVLYMPENIRGEIADADKKGGINIPEKSLEVHIRAKHNKKGMDYNFTVYPGENTKNNFNVRRNCVYRVTVDVKNAEDQHNPSSNCYVVKPNGKVVFEPYNRAETGGDFKIKDYLDPTVEDKKIASVEIIWQTKDCIGDNSDPNNPRVWITPDEKVPLNSKITVLTGEEGNALVGARNSKGTIIWSWHIWVTPNEPDNLGNAVVYTTYRWDESGIHADKPRIPGYGIMPCNIGALAFTSDDDMPYNKDVTVPYYSIPRGEIFPNSQIRTFGMLYQWGRKDPFPPMIYSTGTEDSNGRLDYTDKYTDVHYANDNEEIVHKTSDLDANTSDYLFYSAKSSTESVKYSIEHPTVYIVGGNVDFWDRFYYTNNGDWCKEHNDRLWGAAESSTLELSVEGGQAHLRNDYGTKSIFDPCPAGWRVAPGDLWLGFTKTGLNPETFEDVNYSTTETGKRPGMIMHVQAFQSGPKVYFPLQGTRTNNGGCGNTGLCGNYHNATCDNDDRVNILHLHRDMSVVAKTYSYLKLFKIFEYDPKHKSYYVKSTAGPIRCVRDSK